MTISTAIIYAQQGCKIRREGWKQSEYHAYQDDSLYVKDGLLMSGEQITVLTADDLIADDWVLVQGA